MKQRNRKKSIKITRGASSGWLLSLLIHVGLFFLAGLLVVFTVQQREEKKFVPPPPVERPKMQLKKPKVQVKKNKPKPTQRIVTKVNPASMPEIQLPELGGVADGLAGGVGGFDLMPNLEEVTLFGGGQTIGNDFVGTFYDFKRDRSGRPIPTDPSEFVEELRRFVRGGWRTSQLARFYRSPKKLFATTFMIPPVKSSVAPAAFGEMETGGWCWMAHYKGKLVHHEDIRFRFWGMGDDVMVIRVNGEVVMNACWPEGQWGSYGIGGDWRSDAKNDFRFYLGNNLSRGGDWIELKAGEPVDMEVILGEVPGGQFCSMLTVQVEDEEYERNKQGGPILPIFKTDEPSLDLMDEIYKTMVTDEASVTNGPVFRDYDFSAELEEKEEVVEEVVESQYRTWTLNNGQSFEAEFISVIGDRAILRTADDQQPKILFRDLSSEDREYIDLSTPPSYDLTFVKASNVRQVETTPYLNEDPPRVNDFVFGAKVRQSNSQPYPHELTVEYFAIAQELLGNGYILADRRTSSFIPSKENRFAHEFSGDSIEFSEYVLDGERVGRKYAGNLVVLYDKTGRVVDYSTSNDWLFEHLDNLKKIPVSRYFDKECRRIFPTSPPPTRY
tara:strand:- start:1940 stop:3775 length:1836 start_codon:yes stop_codon:yes gene_type:complete